MAEDIHSQVLDYLETGRAKPQANEDDVFNKYIKNISGATFDLILDTDDYEKIDDKVIERTERYRREISNSTKEFIKYARANEIKISLGEIKDKFSKSMQEYACAKKASAHRLTIKPVSKQYFKFIRDTILNTIIKEGSSKIKYTR